MVTKTVTGLTAQKLRLLLIAGIVLLIIVGVGVFAFSQNILTTYAKSVGGITSDAASSSENLKNLSTLKTTLDSDSLSVERTKALVAESKSYAYQDQIIKDLNAFAANSQVEVSSYTFDTGATASTGASASTPAATTPAATTTPATGATIAPAAGAATATTTGLKTVNVSVSLKSPLKYESVMTFVHQIEQSLTKMQLSGISLSKDSATNNVTASTLTIEVYVK